MQIGTRKFSRLVHTKKLKRLLIGQISLKNYSDLINNRFTSEKEIISRK